MEYLVGPGHEKRAPIDGGILQAPVSDREALVMMMDKTKYDESCNIAQKMVGDGRGEEIIPSGYSKFGPTPVCARRWLSLASPNHDGDGESPNFLKNFTVLGMWGDTSTQTNPE